MLYVSDIDFLKSVYFSEFLVEENNSKFIHDLGFTRKTVSAGQIEGENIFGNAQIPSIFGGNKFGYHAQVDSISYLLTDGYIIPDFSAVISSSGAIIDLFKNYHDKWGGVQKLLGCYWSTELNAINVDELDSNSDCVDFEYAILGVPISRDNYGHFLFDGLDIVFWQANMLFGKSFKIVVPPLKDFQREIFKLLNLDGYLYETSSPVKAKRILFNSHQCGNLAQPTKYFRNITDYMRLSVSCLNPGRRILIQRSNDRRKISNWEEVVTTCQKYSFEVVDPGGMCVLDQIALFSHANVVVGQSGAALANVVFAGTGTRVLEIMPDYYPDAWIRSVCFHLNLNWNLLACRVNSDSISKYENSLWSAGSFHFDFIVPIDELEKSLNKLIN